MSTSQNKKKNETRRSLPNIPVKVCLLCGMRSPYMTRFMNWSDPEKRFATKHYGKSISENSDICGKDKLEASRNHSNDDYVPKLIRQSKNEVHSEVHRCGYENCEVTTDDEKLKRSSFDAESAFFRIISLFKTLQNGI